jgi:hypothetical protein
VKTFVRVGCGVLALIALLAIWYSVAANYDYSALAGAYVFHGNGEACTLYLRPDHTFVQELSRSGELRESQGSWHRYGEAHVSFSNEFLRLSGEEANSAGEAHGQFEKQFGIITTLAMAPIPDGPRFHKRLFSSAGRPKQ